MSVPRHFNQRPRRNMAPPPSRNQRAEVVLEDVPVIETPEEDVVVGEVPVIETPVEEVVETPVEEVVVEEVPVIETPEEEVVVEEAPVIEPPVEVAEEEVVEPTVEEVAVVEPPKAPKPVWNATMKKAELLLIAQELGFAVLETDTKNDIIEALRSV